MKLTNKSWTAMGAVFGAIAVLLMIIFFLADHSRPSPESSIQQTTTGPGSVAVNGDGNDVTTNVPANGEKK
jgi:hypothetical protein